MSGLRAATQGSAEGEGAQCTEQWTMETLPINICIMSGSRPEQFAFCSTLKYCDLYSSGTTGGKSNGGMLKKLPLMGRRFPSSRLRCATTQARFAPAETPPTMKPADGSPPWAAIFSAIYNRTISCQYMLSKQCLPI